MRYGLGNIIEMDFDTVIDKVIVELRKEGLNMMRSVIILMFLFFSMVTTILAEEGLSKDITVYKKPDCKCCNKWITYLEEHGYNVTAINTRDVFAEKRRLGVPPEIKACHTAVIDGYVVEGHATHRDIKRLLVFQPDIKGIAVPDMPVGSPGMEKGDIKEPYNVMSFDEEGKIDVFVKH